NIARMQQQCRAWGVALRPHVKTHKIAKIARMQLDAGAIGITVAKLGEAGVLPGDDVLVAYPLLKPKLPGDLLLAVVARRGGLPGGVREDRRCARRTRRGGARGQDRLRRFDARCREDATDSADHRDPAWHLRLL